MRTGESRDSTPPLLPSSCEACRIYKKTPLRGKKFISPSPPFYVLRYIGSTSLVLLYFIIRPLTYQARSIAQLLSPATLLSSPLGDALLKLVRSPYSLLAALRPSFPILQVPLKNSPDFWYKIGDFGPKIGVLGSIYSLFGSIIRLVWWS